MSRDKSLSSPPLVPHQTILVSILNDHSVKINSQSITTAIVQINMFTIAHDGDEIEDIYVKLNRMLNMTKLEENAIILGDKNARFGEIKDGNIVGCYELGKKYDRRERLKEFCTPHELVIENTIQTE